LKNITQLLHNIIWRLRNIAQPLRNSKLNPDKVFVKNIFADDFIVVVDSSKTSATTLRWFVKKPECDNLLLNSATKLLFYLTCKYFRKILFFILER